MTQENKQPMEEKELNLLELLKGCEGEKFYNPNYGTVTLIGVDERLIMFRTSEGGTLTSPKIFELHTGFASYYPSKESFLKYSLCARAAWDEWEESRQPKYTLEVSYRIFKGHNGYGSGFEPIAFPTEEEANQAADAIRETLMKFHKKGGRQ